MGVEVRVVEPGVIVRLETRPKRAGEARDLSVSRLFDLRQPVSVANHAIPIDAALGDPDCHVDLAVELVDQVCNNLQQV
ncbi:MAG: hypothetical protein HXY20_06665 [Acidobacteria bacterium]|nr:hypothetical protein [Acidobacteriota bacterium]